MSILGILALILFLALSLILVIGGVVTKDI